ncbi:Uncharacterized protein HZ326_22685 [Fusarium oxysporum f. sp. albedinis]|nr:Uncharacterized protein HZ326_22685 [Fusarium oxysporum f. sp. albedinis]
MPISDNQSIYIIHTSFRDYLLSRNGCGGSRPSTITSASSKAVQVWTSVIKPRRLYLRKAFLVKRPSAGIAFYEDGKRLISVDLTTYILV